MLHIDLFENIRATRHLPNIFSNRRVTHMWLKCERTMVILERLMTTMSSYDVENESNSTRYKIISMPYFVTIWKFNLCDMIGVPENDDHMGIIKREEIQESLFDYHYECGDLLQSWCYSDFTSIDWVISVSDTIIKFKLKLALEIYILIYELFKRVLRIY